MAEVRDQQIGVRCESIAYSDAAASGLGVSDIAENGVAPSAAGACAAQTHGASEIGGGAVEVILRGDGDREGRKGRLRRGNSIPGKVINDPTGRRHVERIAGTRVAVAVVGA